MYFSLKRKVQMDATKEAGRPETQPPVQKPAMGEAPEDGPPRQEQAASGNGLALVAFLVLLLSALYRASTATERGRQYTAVAMDHLYPAVLRAGSHLGLVRGPNRRLVTPEELAAHGPSASRVWISVLGNVFDVTAGRKHYGKGGGYECFAGRDGSRAFVTGEFATGCNDDVESLEPSALLGIVNWVGFYNSSTKYSTVGVVAGSKFFDSKGFATPLTRSILRTAEEEKVRAESEEELDWTKNYPGCNVEWSQERGGRVWCDNGRFPRLTSLELRGKVVEKCICESHRGFNQDSRRLYEGCRAEATSCALPVKKEAREPKVVKGAWPGLDAANAAAGEAAAASAGPSGDDTADSGVVADASEEA